MKEESKNKNWGGARPNAGRPATGRKLCRFYLSDEEKEAVREFIGKMRSEANEDGKKM